jgi:HSP20 family molecular chaperone IbpA
MKINNQYEISPFGNTFDSLLSFLTRDNSLPVLDYQQTAHKNVRITNEEKQVRVEFIVPGWKKNDLKLSIEGQRLSLLTDSKNQDLSISPFTKELNIEVSLGNRLDTTKANAKLQNGILTVLIPVFREVKGRDIKIN